MTDWGEFVRGTPEQDRLALLELLFDPATLRHIDAIGVRPGWRCLEVGAGAGSIARALAERGGEVTATDVRLEPLEPLRELGITVLRHDVTVDPDLGPFDLIHARYVLEHVRERDIALARMVSWLKPGGWLVIESGGPVTALATRETFRRGIDAAAAGWVRTLGTDIGYGRSLPGPLHKAGLVEIGAEAQAPVIWGGSAMAAWIAATMRLSAGLAVEEGLITEEGVQKTYADLNDPAFIDYSWLKVSAWGRKPG